MARRILTLVAIASIFSGCAHVHRVDPTLPQAELDCLNRAIQNRRVSVELAGGTPSRAPARLRAEGVHVAADSTALTLLREPSEVEALWGEPRYAVRQDTVLNTLAIARLSTTSRSRGALDGTLLGLGIGVAIGALLGLRMDDPAPADARAVYGGFFCGVLGTGIGLVVGIGSGSTHVFDFTRE